MNPNYNLMQNQNLNFNNFNNMNQNFMNQFMNQINQNQNMFLNMNQNLNQINPDMIQNINQANPIMDQLNQNMDNLNLNMNQNDNLKEEEIEDVLPYIDEPKMLLKFSNISTIKNGSYIKVKLPKSLTKSDLYSIAKKYQTDYYSEIILSCNNYLLKEDDTSIEGIEEGSIINIIEDIDFPDGSYYKELMEKNKNYEKIQFIFRIDGRNDDLRVIQFPKNITVSEMVRAAFSKLLINSKSASIENINSSDQTKIINKFNNKVLTIYFSNPLDLRRKFGKIIYARVFDIANNKNKTIIAIGTLNSINQLINTIENHFSKKLKKIKIWNKEFYKNEIKNFSLKSIGINDNFDCIVEFENQVGV